VPATTEPISSDHHPDCRYRIRAAPRSEKESLMGSGESAKRNTDYFEATLFTA